MGHTGHLPGVRCSLKHNIVAFETSMVSRDRQESQELVRIGGRKSEDEMTALVSSICIVALPAG